jgi:Xaa-Pro aminopeptidase
MALDIAKIQSLIRKKGIDGWLLFDFRGTNALAHEILGIPHSAHLTRRFYYFIPAEGAAVKVVSAIEAHNFAFLPGEEQKFSSHESLAGILGTLLKKGQAIAMEYSPMSAIPYLSRVDAGTVEFIRSFGVEVVSSGDLITLFNALWSDEQYQDNVPVARNLVSIVKASFNLIKEALLAGKTITEYDVQKYINDEFIRLDYLTDPPIIVGVNGNAANPHYAPSDTDFTEIKKGDFVLIDLWAKTKRPDAVWADITWCGYAGETIPEKYVKVFNVVKEARDAALALATERFAKGQTLLGFEIDDAARKVIVDAGYGEYFIHRTGHSITTELHGSGPHMDDYETRDDRVVFPATSFSIEPGIYLPGDFGVRLELDVFVHPDGRVEFTGGEKQDELIAILK